jgi:hypothetical protein
MAHDVRAAGVLLIDGHTRVYHGCLTKLPRRHVSREKLCLRGTTDYWVNALDGQPFFCVTKPIDPGLQKTLEEEIVPRLLTDIPGQPSADALAADPLLHRFTLVFDREGYSPDLFLRLKRLRIAILTYHKHPGPDWPANEFVRRKIIHPNGETSELLLAERGACLSNGLWVREIRRLDAQGRQTSILSTDENNPAAAARHEQQKGNALIALQTTQTLLASLKDQRKNTPKHIQLKDLPPDRRIDQLRGGRKHFIDTIKLIAYRAETAMVQLARETLTRTDDARSFIRGLMKTTINLRPDIHHGILHVELHGQANPIHDFNVAALCAELNETETHYPGTNLRLNYVPLRSVNFPTDQDV